MFGFGKKKSTGRSGKSVRTMKLLKCKKVKTAGGTRYKDKVWKITYNDGSVRLDKKQPRRRKR